MVRSDIWRSAYMLQTTAPRCTKTLMVGEWLAVPQSLRSSAQPALYRVAPRHGLQGTTIEHTPFLRALCSRQTFRHGYTLCEEVLSVAGLPSMASHLRFEVPVPEKTSFRRSAVFRRLPQEPGNGEEDSPKKRGFQ